MHPCKGNEGSGRDGRGGEFAINVYNLVKEKRLAGSGQEESGNEQEIIWHRTGNG